MLTFVIPLVSRALCRNWEHACLLFERTVRSCCNQTIGDFSVVAVGHDRPRISCDSPKVRFVEVDYAFSLQTADTIECPRWPLYEIQQVDKGRKLFRGVEEARRLGSSHVMLLDADDCVSRRLAEFVVGHPAEAGWYVSRGYSYVEGSRWVYVKRFNFQQECGSSHIFALRSLPVPEDPRYDRGFDYYRFVINHAYIVGKMSQRGVPLKCLPLAGAVYTRSGVNLSPGRQFTGRSALRRALNSRPLTKRLRREFGLHPVASVSRSTVA